MDRLNFIRRESLVGDGIVEARDAASAGFERAVGDGDVAFGFPEGQRGVGDVPDAEEFGRGGGEEAGRWDGRVCRWGADYDWFGHLELELDWWSGTGFGMEWDLLMYV